MRGDSSVFQEAWQHVNIEYAAMDLGQINPLSVSQQKRLTQRIHTLDVLFNSRSIRTRLAS